MPTPVTERPLPRGARRVLSAVLQSDMPLSERELRVTLGYRTVSAYCATLRAGEWIERIVVETAVNCGNHERVLKVYAYKPTEKAVAERARFVQLG